MLLKHDKKEKIGIRHWRAENVVYKRNILDILRESSYGATKGVVFK